MLKNCNKILINFYLPLDVAKMGYVMKPIQEQVPINKLIFDINLEAKVVSCSSFRIDLSSDSLKVIIVHNKCYLTLQNISLFDLDFLKHKFTIKSMYNKRIFSINFSYSKRLMHNRTALKIVLKNNTAI